MAAETTDVPIGECPPVVQSDRGVLPHRVRAATRVRWASLPPTGEPAEWIVYHGWCGTTILEPVTRNPHYQHNRDVAEPTPGIVCARCEARAVEQGRLEPYHHLTAVSACEASQFDRWCR